MTIVSHRVESQEKLERGIKQIRTAARNLYDSAWGVNSPEWKAARVLNSLSNALEFGSGLYGNQLQTFLTEYLEAEE